MGVLINQLLTLLKARLLLPAHTQQCKYIFALYQREQCKVTFPLATSQSSRHLSAKHPTYRTITYACYHLVVALYLLESKRFHFLPAEPLFPLSPFLPSSLFSPLFSSFSSSFFPFSLCFSVSFFISFIPGRAARPVICTISGTLDLTDLSAPAVLVGLTSRQELPPRVRPAKLLLKSTAMRSQSIAPQSTWRW